jgi:HSP20 family protein
MSQQNIEIKRGQARRSPEAPQASTWTYRAPVDITETDEAYLVRADMPGSSAEKIEVTFENGQLTLRGQVVPRQAAEQELLVQEYGIGDFTRTVRVSGSVEVAGLDAEYQNGTLTVRLPKSAAGRSRRISVRGT